MEGLIYFRDSGIFYTDFLQKLNYEKLKLIHFNEIVNIKKASLFVSFWGRCDQSEVLLNDGVMYQNTSMF